MNPRPFLACALRLLPLLALLMPVIAAQAEDERLNGNWTLDVERSESYDGAAQRINEQVMALRKRHREEHFDKGERPRSSNKYDAQRLAAEERIREDTVNISWTLTDELTAMLQGKTLKIYQSRMCAVLYDKTLKRLFPINPAGNSYSLKGNEVAHDTLGNTVSWFEGKRLVVDTDIQGGDRLIEHFTVSEDGNELTLLAKLRRSDLGRTVEFKRVFLRD